MAKITLTDMTSGYQSTEVYNTNNTAIKAAIENTLSRDGTTPNTMSADLDLNSNRITNLTDGVNQQDAVTLAQLTEGIAGSSVITIDLIDSEVATNGQVMTSDGAGNATWGTGVGSYLPLAGGTMTGSINLGAQPLAVGGSQSFLELRSGNTSYSDVRLADSNGVTKMMILSQTNSGSIADNVGNNLIGWSWAGGALACNIYGDTHIRDGSILRVQDEFDSSHATFSHDTTDFNTTFVGTTDWNITGATLNLNDGLLTRANLKDYSLESTSPTSSSNAVTFDIANGNSFQHTLTENTTVTLSNPAASGDFCEIIVKFIQDSTGSWTVTWPASVKWPGGTAPVITTTLSTGVDIIALKTWDGGTTWYGNASQDYS